MRRGCDDMTHYIYLCPKCAKEKHKLKLVHFPHGFGIKEVFIDGKEAELVLLSPSQKRKCADCGRWIRHAWRIKKHE